MNEGCGRYELKINFGKTEVMGLTKTSEQPPVNIWLRGETLNKIWSFKYLGSLVKEDGRCDADLKAKIRLANKVFGQLKKIMVSLDINMRTRIRVLKAFVWPVLLFGCEVWTISRVEEETGGSKKVILPEDEEGHVVREKNKPRSFTDGRSKMEEDDAN